MSGNLDRIDLNSDAVLVESENDGVGANLAEATVVRVELPDAKTLTEPCRVAEVGEVEGGGGDGVVKEMGGEGFERKTEAVGECIDLDGEFGFLDGGHGTARDLGTAEQNGSSRVERKEEEAGRVGGSSNSLSEYASEVQNASAASLGVVDVEVKASYGNDFLIQSIVDSGVLRGNDINMSNELNLVVDLKSFGTADAGGMNAKAAASEMEFCVSDLIWGKVKSHPWWPGQIFDPSAASKKAKKYYKRGRHLVAYFGDQTFAWNEDSMIKPFRTHFSQMEKQSSSEEFIYAVDCALDELSRRIELGLGCPCVPEYSNIRTQIIVNAGIREECSRNDGGDRFSGATSFEPGALIVFIKSLSQQSALGRVNRLEFVTAQAQLLAFNRWKCYSELPQFLMLGALLESDEEIPSLSEVKHDDGVNENIATKDKIDGQLSSAKDQDSSSRKRKHNSEDRGRPSKKEKSLAELMLERRSSFSNGKRGLDSKHTVKSTSSPSGRKRKAVDLVSDESISKLTKNPSAVEKNSSLPKKTYRVGDSILRATQLSEQSPILKSVSATSQKVAAKKKGRPSKSQGKKLFSIEDSSTDEMVSYLCLVARNPMKGSSSLNSMVSFFTAFRDSVCLDSLSSQQHKESSLEHAISSDLEEELAKLETEVSVLEPGFNGDLEEKSTELEAETPILEHTPAATIQSITNGPSSLENENESGESPTETPIEKVSPTVGPESAVQSGGNLDVDHLPTGGTLDLGAVKPVSPSKGNGHGDLSPTALILKFTDLDSIPSETNLNKIFSRFGHLKESETEVLKKSSRAKVVFCRRADAEAAFSSAGKYSIFGPSLVSYRLKYMPSSPSNSSSKSTKQSKKDATSFEGTAT